MKYEHIINIIEDIAPPHLAEAWDNSGIQINTGKEEINSIMVCLEITRDVINEAREKSVDLIISHHPLIFGKLDKVDMADGQIGEYIGDLIKTGISVYSTHISFDNAPHGNNYYLGKLLGLKNMMKCNEGNHNIPVISGCFTEEKSLAELCRHIEFYLHLPEYYIRVVGQESKKIKKIAICSGAGGDYIDVALAEGCDAFITGDVKFHDAQKAKARGLILIDAGHYGTEKFFGENFIKQINMRVDNKIKVMETTVNTNPFVV